MFKEPDWNKEKRIISFDSEDDKMNGIAEMYRTNIGFSGIGHNRFIVNQEHLQVLDRNHIKYTHVNSLDLMNEMGSEMKKIYDDENYKL